MSYRILRATRKIAAGDPLGEDNFHEDFKVPTFLLNVSEVFADLADDEDTVMVSDDFVIPMDDSIEEVRQLVGWLTREKGFKIHLGNMKSLAILSDKYMIDHLHHDIETFTNSLIISKYAPTLDLWEFAARYTFPDLENYCLENKSLYEDLLNALADKERGLTQFVRMGIEMTKLNGLVNRVATAALQKHCYFCLAPPNLAGGNVSGVASSVGSRSPPATARVVPTNM